MRLIIRNKHEYDEEDDIDVPEVPDSHMVDLAAAEVIPTKSLPSGKVFSVLAGFDKLGADDFMTLGGAT